MKVYRIHSQMTDNNIFTNSAYLFKQTLSALDMEDDEERSNALMEIQMYAERFGALYICDEDGGVICENRQFYLVTGSDPESGEDILLPLHIEKTASFRF